ncbi:MAG TPA: right-handed parallel beta-helix repeat-containing protein [Anaeromyxobacteraceae bacterium]|nr:right-handed parallel beta-helix repeat-containing protein [Anaeromyxobacteraceae bacterium]
MDAAECGDTVTVLAGDYYETPSQVELDKSWGQTRCAAVLIHKAITLKARGPVRIIMPASAVSPQCINQDSSYVLDGIVAEGTADQILEGIEIEGFTVQGFANNGIKLRYVKHFNVERNASLDNLENGIWPTLSANGQVKNNVAYGSLDSALWVEASQNVRVIDNELATSPTGIEVTLSKDVVIENNNVHDNTVGIGLYHPAAAGLPPQDWPPAPYGNWHVASNYVHNNNMVNPVEGGGEVAQLPPGLGMLILGVSHVDVKHNWVEKNSFVGVALLDWCVAAAADCAANGVPPGFEDTALHNIRVVGNKFAYNHTATSFPDNVPPELQALKSDIMFIDGSFLGLPSGTDDCQADNILIKPPPPNAGILMYVVPSPSQIGVDLFPTCAKWPTGEGCR